MKLLRPGLRTFIFGLYIILTIGSLIVLNQFFLHKTNQITSGFDRMQLQESLGRLHFATPEDSLAARGSLNQYGESLLGIKSALRETRIYSVLILVGLILASGLLFTLIFLRLSKPLVALQNATEQIRQGNYKVQLPEKGIHEMKTLANSFNRMSDQLAGTQKQLLLAEKEMIWKDLSRILAHEIKNPLTPIQLAVQRLGEKLETEPEKLMELLPDTLRIIQQEVENLRLLAQEFSTFAKAAQPQPENFDPAAAIRETVASYQADVPISLDLQENLSLCFDRTHFYQILTNIIQNGIDASEAGQPLAVSLRAEGNGLLVSIRDQGCGIPEEDLGRIFEPYFSRKHYGTGLGLALVKRLAEANQASIRVSSQIGRGSEFTLVTAEAAANQAEKDL